MVTEIRARYTNGVLVPLEPLDLEEGSELTVSLNGAPPKARGVEAARAIRKTAGAWKGIVDGDELVRSIYADRLKPSRPVPEL